MENELFYVGIKEPTEIRKELLTGSKTIIDSLKRYEKYKNIKENKLQYILQLKRVFDELLVLNKKLRTKLPQVPIKKTPEITKPTQTKLAKTNIDLLEEELSKIEERLSGLE